MGASLIRRRYPTRISPLRRALRRIEALYRLSRPINLLLIAATSLSALLLVWYDVKDFSPPWLQWGMMLISTLFIAAGGYWLNDLYDQSIDRINRPNRALWVARTGQRLLFTATIAAWSTGVALALFLPPRIFLLHLGAILALAWYARFGKRTGLPGNVVIAILTGLVPWEVFLLTGRTTYAAAWMIPLAISFNLVRELVKDAEDLPGDRTYGVRSLPGRLRSTTWQNLLQGLWLALIGLVLLPALVHYILWRRCPLFYIAAALPTTVLPLLWGLTESQDYRFMSLLLKLAMAGGLLALWML